jgi:hypothetical protein
MTKFGVYHGKDEKFRREYADGGTVAPGGGTIFADSRMTLNDEPNDQMRETAAARKAFQRANPTSEG